MSESERKSYKERGGYCPDSARFVEDLSHALHVSSSGEARKSTNAQQEDRQEKAQEEVQEKANRDKGEEEKSVDEKEEPDIRDSEPDKARNLDEESAPDGYVLNIKHILKTRYNQTDNIPKHKRSIGAGKIKRMHPLAIRGAWALADETTLAHLGLSIEFIRAAVHTLLDASDHVLRSAVIEATLTPPATLHDGTTEPPRTRKT